MVDDNTTPLELREFFRQAPVPLVILMGPEHKFVLANPPYEALIGRKAEGKTLREIFSLEEVGYFIPILDGVFQTGKSWIGKEIPMSIELKLGEFTEHFLNIGYHPLRDANNVTIGILAIVTDVTEQVESRKLVERAKSEVELETQNIRSLFQETPEFFCILGGEDFRYEYVNPSHRILFAGEDMTGKTVKEAQPELVGSPFLDFLGEVLRSGKAATIIENRAQIRNEEHFLDLIYAPRRNSLGQVDGILCLGNDRTERVRTRKILQDNERNLRAMADIMPQVVWSARPDGILDSINRRWVEYSGSEKPEDWHLFVHPDDQERAFKTWGSCVASGDEYEIEFRLKRLDGAYRWHLVRASALRSASGTIERWYGTCTDIQDQKNSEVELLNARQDAENANAAKSAFLANMSHEIRTPLGAVMGFVRLMKNPALSRETLSEYISVIERNSDQLLRIIDDILDLSKVEAGKLLIEEIDFSLPEVLADLSSLMGFRARENGIGLQLQAESPIPVIVQSDPTRIRQILTNVIGNAIKFTSKGSVTLGIKYEPQTLIFRITDTGLGISEAQAKELFQPFHQADLSTTRKFGGTGLGLVLTKRLSEALGGDFYLEKSQIGVGSTFIAKVSVKVLDSTKLVHDGDIAFSTSPATVSVETGMPLLGMRVLVVDDSPDNRTLARVMLSELGAQVTLANDGFEGVVAAQSSQFDAVLMDIQMPRMDGYEATRKLRQTDDKLPIIALTAHAMKEERQRAAQSGFSSFLSKPINQKALIDTLTSIKNLNVEAVLRSQEFDILVVEDDMDILAIVKELLEGEDYKIRTSTSAEEAIIFLENNPWPAVILIDLTLPGMSGSELIERLNQNPQRKNAKLIVASGWDDLAQKAQALNADSSIRKPYDIEKFLNHLRNFFS